MTRAKRFESIERACQPFLQLDADSIGIHASRFPDYDGPNLEETIGTIKNIQDILRGLRNLERLSLLPYQQLQHLDTIVPDTFNSWINFRNSGADFESFKQMSMRMDSLLSHLRQSGVHIITTDLNQLETLQHKMGHELTDIVAAKEAYKSLYNDMSALVSPAAATALSNAFTSRQRSLFFGRLVWAGIAALLGAYGIYETYSLLSEVTQEIRTFSATSQKPLAYTTTDLFWLSVFTRTAILIPLYIASAFSFSQYRKERNFEEEYAHKAAVATSLPKYNELTRDPVVRDQIVTGATNVIFSSPLKPYDNLKDREKVFSGLSGLLDAVSKLKGKD